MTDPTPPDSPRTEAHRVRWIDSGRDEPPENGYWRCQCGVTFAPDAVESGIAHGWAEARASSEVPPDLTAALTDALIDAEGDDQIGPHYTPEGLAAYLSEHLVRAGASEVPTPPSPLTAIFKQADALRAYFMERGWSIHMEDNGRAVIDPFAAIVEAAGKVDRDAS